MLNAPLLLLLNYEDQARCFLTGDMMIKLLVKMTNFVFSSQEALRLSQSLSFPHKWQDTLQAHRRMAYSTPFSQPSGSAGMYSSMYLKGSGMARWDFFGPDLASPQHLAACRTTWMGWGWAPWAWAVWTRWVLRCPMDLRWLARNRGGREPLSQDNSSMCLRDFFRRRGVWTCGSRDFYCFVFPGIRTFLWGRRWPWKSTCLSQEFR